MNTATSTSTWEPDGYPDDITRDLMRHVRHTPREEDALYNIPLILEQYKKSIGWKELLVLLFSK